MLYGVFKKIIAKEIYLLYNNNMGKNNLQQKETWKVFGSDEVLQDKNLIEYYKLNLYDEKLRNKLLGDFTSEGKYVLPDKIKETLVNVKKLIVHAGYNTYVAETETKSQTVRFFIKYWEAEKLNIANLYIIENIDGEDLNTFVAQFAAEKDESFLVRVKKVFNLYNDIDEFADKYLEELESQYDLYKMKSSERDFVVELQSEFYLYELLQILKEQGGEKGKKITEQMELEIDAKKQLTNKEGMYTSARLKMDKLIIAAGGFNALMQEIPTLPKIVQNYVKPVKDYDDISKKLDEMKPPTDKSASNKSGDKKSNTKKGGAKKGGAKKGGKKDPKKSGGGKKNDGGKSAKKDKPKDLMLGSDTVKNWWANRQAARLQPEKQPETEKNDNIIITKITKKTSRQKVQTPAPDGILKKTIVARAPKTIVSCLDAFGLPPMNPPPVSEGDFVASGQIIEENNLSYIEIAKQETVVDVVEMSAGGIGSDDLVATT